MKLALQKAWYRPRLSLLSALLLPMTGLFAVLSSARRAAYRMGWLKQTKLNVPVIVIGNITVGGSGKTPLVMELAESLGRAGFRPGVLSRGYGGNADGYPTQVQSDSDASEVGDEPLLLAQRLSCPIVVDPNRCRGGQYLQDKLACNVILCDDGLQHYALARDIEIIVLDGQRMMGNGHLLPAGPLREGTWRLQNCDYVVLNGDVHDHKAVQMTLKPGILRRVVDWQPECRIQDLDSAYCAIAGIGNPERFFSSLATLGSPPTRTFAFPDHHAFSPTDFPDGAIVMTEKDAVKCREFAKQNWYFLPVTATLSDGFIDKLFSQLQQIK